MSGWLVRLISKSVAWVQFPVEGLFLPLSTALVVQSIISGVARAVANQGGP